MSDSPHDTKISQSDTLPGKNYFTRNFFADEGPEFDVQLAATSHAGKVRDQNEDHYAIAKRSRSCEMLLSNLPVEDVAYVDDRAYVLMVADGIGGSQFGDLASQLALETTLQAAGLATSWIMKFKDLDAQEVRKRIGAYVSRIQESFAQHGNIDPDKRLMGTTFTGAYLLPPHVILGHIGDSRAYLLRDGQLTQMTRDQTLAQAYIDAGAEKEEVKRFSHVLINSLGCGREFIDTEVLHVELKSDDRLLLCTDGLSDMVDDDVIAKTLATTDLQVACDQLLEKALAGGGKDNITIVLCDIARRVES